MPKAATPRLTREDWLLQALEVLAAQGPAKLNIQSLCQALGVSRGSFYWHFADRAAFIHALLEEWHLRYSAAVPEIIEAGGGTGRDKFARLLRAVVENDLTRFDLPIRSWAMQEPEIAKLVERTDHFRLDYVTQLFEEMGFEGEELAMRARTALSTLTMLKTLRDERGFVDSPERAELLCRVLCGD